MLDLRLHPQEKIRWLETAVAAARQIKNKEAEGAHLGNLGLAYAALGETRKAIEYYEQASEDRSRDRGPEGRRKPPGQPGQCLRRPGETRKAIDTTSRR